MRNDIQLYSRLENSPLWNVMNEFDGFFDRAFRPNFNNDKGSQITASTLTQTHIEEDENAFLLSVDMPGVKRDDVKIDIHDRVLTVSGDRKSSRKNENGEFQSLARFERSFALPETVDLNSIEANLEDGVLFVSLPKAEVAKPRSIEIKTGKPSFFSKLINNGKEQAKSDKAETH